MNFNLVAATDRCLIQNTRALNIRRIMTFFIYEERQALKALLEPFIFGENLAHRLVAENVPWAKTRCQELCLKMARLST